MALPIVATGFALGTETATIHNKSTSGVAIHDRYVSPQQKSAGYTIDEAVMAIGSLYYMIQNDIIVVKRASGVSFTTATLITDVLIRMILHGTIAELSNRLGFEIDYSSIITT